MASTIGQKAESPINEIIDDNINNVNLNGNGGLKNISIENNIDSDVNFKTNVELVNSFNTKNIPPFKTNKTDKISMQESNDSNSKSNSSPNKTCISSRKRSAEDFKFLECIGEGSYSKVYRAVSKKNVHTYAIKILNKQHIHKEKKRKYVTIEKNTLNVLGKHPGIVTLYYTFQDPKSLYFVIDFAQNGELLNLMHKLGSLSVELSRYYTIQLIDTISFIHGRGIIHRDLKPENILLGSDWKLMITDFGAAKFVDLPEKNGNDSKKENENNENDDDNDNDNNTPTESLGSFVGTAEYISPELLKYNQSSFASDYWSLGCIIYQMFVGIPPFKAANEYETFERIVDLIYAFPDPHKFPIPSYVVDLVQNLLVEDPKHRLGSEGIKQHPWFKDIDWNNDSNIWGTVPKLEPYRPEKYFKIKRAVPAPQTKAVRTQNQQLPQHQKVNNSKAQSNSVVPHGTQNKLLTANNVSKPSIKQLDYVNDKSRTALKKQIMNAQNNTQLMNKVNNRINEKGNVITKRAQTSNSRSTHILPSVVTSAPIKVSSPVLNNQLSSFDVSKKRLSNGKPINNLNSPTQKKRISRNNSLSSLLTTGDSAKSVIIKSSTPNTTPTMIPLTTFSSNNTVKKYPNLTDNKNRINKTYNHNISQAKSTASSPLAYSPNMGNKQTFPSKTGYSQLPLFVQKPRVTSSDAAAAAGAIGTLLTHKRHLNSTSSTDTQYKQLQNHQKQLINPVLLDRQIPSIITSKLMQHETILKLDNIFKSEISHKANQFTAPGETLNHEILENIIHKYDRELSKDLKACVMVITSFARLFIYELNDDFRLHNPQSLTQIQALDFYLKIIEIKLTNKNVSLYDYEFDEEMHEGYLILELANVNKLVFLSAWDRSRLIKGGINSNVRVGFNVNENESWVKSFLKAKDLLKKREAATHSNLNKMNDYNKLNKSKTEGNDNQNKSHRSGSASSMHQSFRKLKINTHSKIRSLSSSSNKDNPQSSHISSSPSMPSFSSAINNNDIERRQSNSGSQNGSLLNGVRELAMGVKAGFKGKDDANEVKRIRSDSDKTKDISDISDYSTDEVVEMNDEQLSQILKLNKQEQNISTYKNKVTNNLNHRQLNSRKSVPKLTSAIREREIAKEKAREKERKDTKAQNHFFTHPAKKESKAAIAAAMAVGKKR